MASKKKAFDVETTRKEYYMVDPTDVVVIGVDTDDGDEHPLYDERINLPIDDNMVRNIMAIGVKKPVLVRKVDGKPVVIDGRRRTLHAREANRLLSSTGQETLRVPVIPEKGDDKDAVVAMISTNEFVAKDSPLNRARKARRLVEELGMSPKEAGEKMGVSDQTIRNWIDVTTLDPEAQKAFDDGALPVAEARDMARTETPPEEQRERARARQKQREENGGKAKRNKKRPKALDGRLNDALLAQHKEKKIALSPIMQSFLRWKRGDYGQAALENRLNEAVFGTNDAHDDEINFADPMTFSVKKRGGEEMITALMFLAGLITLEDAHQIIGGLMPEPEEVEIEGDEVEEDE